MPIRRVTVQSRHSDYFNSSSSSNSRSFDSTFHPTLSSYECCWFVGSTGKCDDIPPSPQSQCNDIVALIHQTLRCPATGDPLLRWQAQPGLGRAGWGGKRRELLLRCRRNESKAERGVHLQWVQRTSASIPVLRKAQCGFCANGLPVCFTISLPLLSFSIHHTTPSIPLRFGLFLLCCLSHPPISIVKNYDTYMAISGQQTCRALKFACTIWPPVRGRFAHLRGNIAWLL